MLLHAGARDVSPGEPPPVGSTIAAIEFVTPLGLPLIATVAPLGEFDHNAPIVEGERSIVEVAGTEVHLTPGAPDSARLTCPAPRARRRGSGRRGSPGSAS